MPDVQAFVDVEGAVKAWARANSSISALVSARVFLGVNKNAASPQLVVSRVAGGADPSEAPIDRPRVQFDSWAATRAAAANLAYTVMQELREIEAHDTFGSTAVVFGAQVVLGPRYLTDEADERAGWHRYVLDADLVLRKA